MGVIGETMKSLPVALLFVLLASATAVPAPRVGDCAAADDYIDEVLVNVAKKVVEEGYDPAELPGDEVHFSQDIGFITIHGSARYDQGHFDGLSTIHRTGETQLCAGETIDIHANIGLRDARAGYHVAAEFQGIEVGASAEAKIDSIDIYLGIHGIVWGRRTPIGQVRDHQCWPHRCQCERPWPPGLDPWETGRRHRRHHQGLHHPPHRGTYQGHSAKHHQRDDAAHRHNPDAVKSFETNIWNTRGSQNI